MRRYTISELYDLRGTELGISSWHQVVQADVDAFGHATQDLEDIHVDPAAARAKGFDGTIAHGIFVLGMGPLMLTEIFSVESRLALYYGFDRVRFTATTPIGSSLRMSVSVVDGREANGAHVFTFGQTFECDRADRPVCHAQSLCAYYD